MQLLRRNADVVKIFSYIRDTQKAEKKNKNIYDDRPKTRNGIQENSVYHSVKKNFKTIYTNVDI